jgi:type I restriction enzyme S subunit
MDKVTADLFPVEFENSELGEIPKGWSKRRADEFSRVTIGKTPPRKEPEWFSESEVDIPWVSIRDLGKSGTYVSQTSERLTQKGVDRFNVRVVPRDTVILSFKLTVGRVAITDVELATNEAIAHFGIDPASGVTTEFLYLSLLDFNFDSLGSTSSIATAVNSDSIRSVEICIPPAELIEAFTAIVKPLFSMIRSNQAGTRTLAETRDALLPRLLSGELNSYGVGE